MTETHNELARRFADALWATGSAAVLAENYDEVAERLVRITQTYLRNARDEGRVYIYELLPKEES